VNLIRFCCCYLFLTFAKAVEVDADSDDDFHYEEVDVDDPEEADLEEDLDTALQTLKAKASGSGEAPPQAAVQKRPETADDFIRNFLHRAGLVRTLDAFQVCVTLGTQIVVFTLGMCRANGMSFARLDLVVPMHWKLFQMPICTFSN
jgi:hypothetical protein